jgi:hypothetical protein
MEADMLKYATLRTKDLGQEAPSADNVSEKARAKAVRASNEFWSTEDESLLEQPSLRPLLSASCGRGASRPPMACGRQAP